QLDTAISYSKSEWYQEGEASEQVRIDYVKERLRLFYVGITRAKEELVVTWNTGGKDNQQALPFVALQAYWESMHEGS
ncbi:MAG TPA: 3'-5' exonuclease, partial [Anaerolineales bacterium]|nr:3'-5' exonuclease [Anaerolineales bacterium]